MALSSIKNLQRERQAFLARAVVGTVFCLLGTALLIVRLFDLQILQNEYFQTRANENRMRVMPVAPVRGLIYDRHGALLAQNKPAFVLEVIPEQVEDMPGLLKRLTGVVQLTDQDIGRFKERVRKTPRYRPVPLRNNLTMEELARYEVDRHAFRGVDVSAGLTRNYPLGVSGAHIVGYVGGITESELKEAAENTYEGLSLIGKTGVEKSSEDTLRGESGAKIIEANAYGRPLRELDYRRGYPGRNLYLSIDAKVQLVAEQALGELDGAVVALDPRSGEIIALVSKPGFDPHLFIEGIDYKTYSVLSNDPKRPLFNRALQGTYPPGSTVKPAMAIAGLEYGVVTPDDGVYCRGEISLPGSSRKYRCWKRSGHGFQDMVGGVMRSCDVYFYELAIKLGIDRMHDSMTRLGLGHKTGVDLPLEKSGLFPSREWKLKRRKEQWYPGETLNVGIGQGYTSVTPLQLAQMTARIAMRGKGFKPHVVYATQDAITRQVTPVPPVPLDPIELKDNRNWQRVIDAMIGVAHGVGGTAARIGRDSPYQIAAKTGTAQVAAMRQDEKKARSLESTPLHLRDHALFVAFAPADDPKIAVAVIAEHAGHGGSIAAPIARQVMDMYLLGEVRYNAGAAAPAAAVATPEPDADGHVHEVEVED
ncbi:penicillin-binding protein 2 [Solimonas sp. K1W22B-7]|uniref:penicillin-binding protein 2 n=1 Tax=Solimonas sp. K1W22B-7 TaxID=2303331 RepID=UPI000E32F786|nr:penicillin-binding protein 2 [Solimonas sp. K1W22B-7]AXQ30281.1 penicillin-binding protein 2 [Solimonas sp. K1W22B-7]